jgi:hypothetical protein
VDVIRIGVLLFGVFTLGCGGSKQGPPPEPIPLDRKFFEVEKTDKKPGGEKTRKLPAPVIPPK